MSDDQESDDAAGAFETLRGEVALLRQAIEGLTAGQLDGETSKVEPADYAPTLAKLVEGIGIVMREVVKLSEMPALKLTPETLAAQIVAAGAAARRANHDALTRATGEITGTARDMRGIVASALTAERQRTRQLRYSAAGLVAGILLWILLPGLIARELTPASWRWPERLARRNLGAGSMWDGARQMAAAGSPATWNAMIEGRTLVGANQKALAKCRDTAAKADKPVKCTIMTGPADVDDRQ